VRVLRQDEVTEAFGNPARFIRSDGTIGPGWEQQIMGTALLPTSLPRSWNSKIKVIRFKAHKKIAALLTAALKAVFDEDAWGTVNDFGGCYNWRTMRTNRSKLSRHAWAIAIDLDVRDNEQGRLPRMNSRVVAIMAEHGFMWGGLFPGATIDGQHFEASDETLELIRRVA
jgi:hypothetical protein